MSIIPQVFRPDVPISLGDILYRVQRLEAYPPSIAYQYPIKVTADNTFFIAGDSKFVWMVTQEIDGWELVVVEAMVSTVGSTDTVVQVRNVTQAVDMLTLPITIDAGDYSTCTAAIPPAISATDDVVTHCDMIAIDVDDAGTGAKGLWVALTFYAPEEIM